MLCGESEDESAGKETEKKIKEQQYHCRQKIINVDDDTDVHDDDYYYNCYGLLFVVAAVHRYQSPLKMFLDKINGTHTHTHINNKKRKKNLFL